MNKFLIVIIVIASLTLSCNSDSKLEQEISEIDISFTTERFDQLFGSSSQSNLPRLKKAYPFLFPKQFNDSIWIAEINDTLQQQLRSEVSKAYSNFKNTEDKIHSLFQHLKYHFKAFNTPRVITVTSNVEYRNKVIVTDSIVLIALDTYLGAHHEFYDNIHQYIKQNFEATQIVPDLAEHYAKKQIFQHQRKTLLDEMIYSGKVLYFRDAMLPNILDEHKIGYTKEDYEWAQANESNIWRHFVEKELLFSTDTKLASRFINPAPFSKFYLELDVESPGRIGQYIGWQIVRAYMKNNTVSLQDMLNKEADEIFTNSKFKPRK